MNSIMIAISISSVMLILGMICRSKVSFLKKMLVPVSIIGGVFGLFFMNLIGSRFNIGTDIKDFSNIVDVLFALSFISIGLSSTANKNKKTENSAGKGAGTVRGAIGMGLIWCILYALTAIIGVLVIAVTGKAVNMDSMYGILIPFAFCQGPGQASTYGRIFEYTYGFKNAEMVALTFAVMGFFATFGLGVPLAKYGLKKGLGKNKTKISKGLERGYFIPEEQRESIGKVTTPSGNIETLSVHVALMGVSYLIAISMAQLIAFVPGLGETFSKMLFFWGMLAAYIVKYVLRKWKIEYLINVPLQSKITGWTTDYLVVCAFMAIQISALGSWMFPIVIEAIVCTLVTFVICVYFGSRLGSDHDFERILGLYGTCTGTTPSGVALLRMVDPKLQTPTTNELGMMNMAMFFSTPTMILITLVGLGSISMPIALAGLLVTIIIYLVLLKLFGVWNKPSFSLLKGRRNVDLVSGIDLVSGNEKPINPFLQGILRMNETKITEI